MIRMLMPGVIGGRRRCFIEVEVEDSGRGMGRLVYI